MQAGDPRGTGRRGKLGTEGREAWGELKPATPRDTPPNGVKTLDGGFMTPFGPRSASWHFYGATMGDLARFLSIAGRPVRDKTGLTGRYDFPLEQIPDPMPPSPDMVFNWPVDPLGLTLKPGKEMRSRFVIDHIEKPRATAQIRFPEGVRREETGKAVMAQEN